MIPQYDIDRSGVFCLPWTLHSLKKWVSFQFPLTFRLESSPIYSEARSLPFSQNCSTPLRLEYGNS